MLAYSIQQRAKKFNNQGEHKETIDKNDYH